MCLIVTAPSKSLIPIDKLRNGHAHNNDAWGLMFPKHGRVQTLRGLSDFSQFEIALGSVPKKTPLAIHFRFATHGAKTIEMTHPFRLLDKSTGIDLCVMHNGILDKQYTNETNDLSDTALLVETMLKPLLAKNAGLIRDGNFQRLLASHVGATNKLVFLEGTGQFHYVNGEEGKKIDGAWYSNEYSLAPPVISSPYSFEWPGHKIWKKKSKRNRHYMNDWLSREYSQSQCVTIETDDTIPAWNKYTLTGMSNDEIFEIVASDPEAATDYIVSTLEKHSWKY